MSKANGAANQRTNSRRIRGDHADANDGVRNDRRRDEHAIPDPTTDSFQVFLNQAAKYPLLTASEEIELAKRIERGDLAAKERLINSNLRLVIKFAKRYQGHGLSLQDLIQEAMVGLIRAAEKFDWRRGYKFSTYAVLWIKQSMQRGLDNSGRTVRIPAHIAQRERTFARIESELRAELNRDPTDEEIAAKSKIPVEDIAPLRDLTRVTASLDQPIGEGDTTFGELHVESKAGPVDELVDREHESVVADALARLPENERRVIEMRFGTDGEASRSLRDAGRELKVSQERARQLEAQALKRLISDPALASLHSAA